MNGNSMIGIFTKNLPVAIKTPLCREYEWRKNEIQHIWDKGYERYGKLRDCESTVDALLAISLYYRYVVANLDGASDFYVKINRSKQTEIPIRIGGFALDDKERRRLLAVHIHLGEIVNKYQIPPGFFEFADTVDFLRNCMDLYSIPEEYAEENTI